MARVSMRGQVNHVAWRHAIAGGNWANGAFCGARTLNLNANPWNANGNVGVRGVSDLHSCSERAPRYWRHPASQGDQPRHPGRKVEHKTCLHVATPSRMPAFLS